MWAQQPLSPGSMVALPVVIASSWLHMNYPPKEKDEKKKN
jgi:hypothetical protein